MRIDIAPRCSFSCAALQIELGRTFWQRSSNFSLAMLLRASPFFQFSVLPGNQPMQPLRAAYVFHCFPGRYWLHRKNRLDHEDNIVGKPGQIAGDLVCSKNCLYDGYSLWFAMYIGQFAQWCKLHLLLITSWFWHFATMQSVLRPGSNHGRHWQLFCIYRITDHWWSTIQAFMDFLACSSLQNCCSDRIK